MHFEHEKDLINYLQGMWEREDKKITLTIFDGFVLRVIYIEAPREGKYDISMYAQKTFTVGFDGSINAWRISSLFFGENSIIEDITENNFSLTVKHRTVIVPNFGTYTNDFKVIFQR